MLELVEWFEIHHRLYSVFLTNVCVCVWIVFNKKKCFKRLLLCCVSDFVPC